MSTPAILATRAQEMAQANPSNAPEKKARTRISLALPQLKLRVPEIPGYKLYWFRGTPARLQQAMAAGYTFVSRDDVHLAEVGVGNDLLGDGNSDLGDRVSVVAGDEMVDGQGARLYLMKIPNEFWDEDQRAIDEKHEKIAAQLRGEAGFAQAGMDTSNRYSRGEQRRILFQPRRP